MPVDFESKIAPLTESGCHIWMGAVNGNGYGQLKDGGKFWQAHRYSWFINNGEIPEGMCVLHKCDIPLCVNPQHLFIGTQIENIRDRTRKGRSAREDRFGHKNHQSKLTVDNVSQIKKLLRSGLTQGEIAAKYKVHQTTISRIKLNKAWTYGA